MRKERSGTSEFILGAWCIGTVTDSAASRAVMHANQVRTAPSSMAINVNVNVEWWDGDKLYQHYMDKDRGHYRDEAQHPAVDLARKAHEPLVPNSSGEPYDYSAVGGFDLSPTIVQKMQHTVLQRNEPSTRSAADYVRDVRDGSLQAKSPDAGAVNEGYPKAMATGLKDNTTGFGGDEFKACVGGMLGDTQEDEEVLRGLAINRLSTGKGEYEGVYVQPDSRGVNEDPEGLRIYDLRTLREADYAPSHYVNAAGTDVALVETRHWAAARNGFIT